MPKAGSTRVNPSVSEGYERGHNGGFYSYRTADGFVDTLGVPLFVYEPVDGCVKKFLVDVVRNHQYQS